MAVEEILTEKALINALEAVLQETPMRALETFVKQANLMTGGLRLGKPGSDRFLSQVIVTRCAGKFIKKYEASLATLLRTYMPEARLMTMLAPEELTTRRAQFTVFFGKARFILALLTDAREDVRKEAQAWMADSGAELPDAETAQTLIREAFSPVVAVGQGVAGATSNAQTRAELAETKRLLEEAKKAAKRERHALEEEAAKVAREHKEALAQKDFVIAEFKRRVEECEGKLKREEATRNLRVNELLSIRQVELFRGWLKPVCDVEALLKESKALPLVERAGAVLAAQRKADRAAARRHEAETQLMQMETLLAEVEAVLAASQRVLPETNQLREELITQCDAYRKGLSTELDVFSALAKQIAAQIDATTETDYRAVRDWLKATEQMGAITPLESAALWQRFQRRAATWATSPDWLDPDSEAAVIRKRNPHLAAAFEGQGELLLFLDGHNMLNGLGRYRVPRGKPQSHEDARKQLEKDIVRQFADLPLVSVHLVWDGAEKSQHNLGSNVLVHFSGGTGEHRADKYIINQMEFFKRASDIPMVLVTADNGFAGDARKCGAEVCSLHDFEAFLNVRS